MKKEFPKGEIKLITGRSLVINGDDIDTDRIIPARFLKCVSFSALGEQVFADDRKELHGNHPFDLEHHKGSNILIVNDNFGCGSSREHAPQALMRWGIRLIIGESFAEIFFGNCLALGIPCMTASKPEINKLQRLVTENHNQIWDFNLKELTITNQKESFKLDLEAGAYKMLYTGKWDATSQLLDANEKIINTAKNLPYLNNFK
tara:strand:- start:305 stop:916 length:612 start_codon:yes stop_codon:yes gene_type:complete